MKLLENMLLTEVGDDYIVVPVGSSKKEFNGVVRLNSTGKDIWDGLSAGKNEDEIAEMLVEKYDGIDKNGALSYIHGIIVKLREGGILKD